MSTVVEILVVVVKINDSISLAVSLVELFQDTKEFNLDFGLYFKKTLSSFVLCLRCQAFNGTDKRGYKVSRI